MLADAELVNGDEVGPVTERVWKLGEDGFLVTWSEETGVLAYSLTTSSKGFKPKFRIGAAWNSDGSRATVKLGRTAFT
ncbi:hypothetical protein ACFWSF_38380 [Streptomyces sp. NPDC058611]|uniref:hypothetical protein n=1 Tax=unclassified Streptomyces TaxID=2593676 RepID=UPI00364FA45C